MIKQVLARLTVVERLPWTVRSHAFDLLSGTRQVWSGCAKTTETFLGNPRIPVGEKQRLTAEHDRAHRVIAAIDDAAIDQGTTEKPQ